MTTAEKLQAFRLQCERAAGIPINQVEVPLLHVLHDICQVLNIPQSQRLQVLGRNGVRYIRAFQQSAAGAAKRRHAKCRSITHRRQLSR
jgi:hypothetical protein